MMISTANGTTLSALNESLYCTGYFFTGTNIILYIGNIPGSALFVKAIFRLVPIYPDMTPKPPFSTSTPQVRRGEFDIPCLPRFYRGSLLDIPLPSSPAHIFTATSHVALV